MEYNLKNFILNFIFLSVLIIIFIYSLSNCQGQIRINEVMYDSNGTDTDHEWLELYNFGNEEINLSGWKFFEGGTNHAITLYSGNIELDVGDYAVIVQNPEIFLIDNPNFQGNILDSSFSLSNTGEYIAIKDSSLNIVDEFNYSSSLGATGDGNTLQFFDYFWKACLPTPGYANNCSQEINETNETGQTNETLSESYIEILDYPDIATFGEEIDLEFHVYKGDTSKYAVYVYVQDEEGDKVSEKITVHAGTSSTSSKFKDYYFNEEILLDCLSDSGDYEIVIEGLNIIEKKTIEIKKCENIEEKTSTLKTEYLIENPEQIQIGEKITIPVKIINNENIEKNFLIWSYIYRGSKCYSCINVREENALEMILEGYSENEIYLENIISDAEPGEYSLKIKILKEGLVTPKEFTYPISVVGNSDEEIILSNQNILVGNILENNGNELGSSQVNTKIIESNKSKLLEITPYIVSSFSLLFCIYLIIKKI